MLLPFAGRGNMNRRKFIKPPPASLASPQAELLLPLLDWWPVSLFTLPFVNGGYGYCLNEAGTVLETWDEGKTWSMKDANTA